MSSWRRNERLLRGLFQLIQLILSLPFRIISSVLLLFNIDISGGKIERVDNLPMKTRLMSLPDNLVMPANS